MSDDTTENKPSALSQVIAANEVTFVADPDHQDPNISKAMNGPMAQGGAKHLYLEHDPLDVSVHDLVKQDNEYGRMIKQAINDGMQVHMYDDRSAERARDARFPEESALRQKMDPYFNDAEGLIAKAPSPERMAAYIKDMDDNRSAEIETRNARMAENLDREMRAHPGEKSVVMLGARHLDDPNDVDDQLRARGHQSTTVEINSANTSEANLVRRLSAPDKADVIVSAETGDAMAYKVPGTNELEAARGADIPWRNSEPVATPAIVAPQSASQAAPPNQDMYAALLAAQSIDLSWVNKGTVSKESQPETHAEISMPSVTKQVIVETAQGR